MRHLLLCGLRAIAAKSGSGEIRLEGLRLRRLLRLVLRLKWSIGGPRRKERVVSSLLRRLLILLGLRVAACELLRRSDLVSHGLLVLLDGFEKIDQVWRRALQRLAARRVVVGTRS